MSEMDEIKSPEPEYEDDFEKDLDWLINEDEDKENNSDAIANEQNYDKLEERKDIREDAKEMVNEENGRESPKTESLLHVLIESNSNESSSLESVPEFLGIEIDDEEAKRYITEKIEEANKQLELETVNENRERKLKFKDNLVDLEVPPLEFSETEKNESSEEDVVDSLSQLQVSESPPQEKMHLDENGIPKEEHKDGKILVERDGKFELVNIRDIENQGFLPPINGSKNENESSKMSGKSFPSNEEASGSHQKVNSFSNGYLPQPPGQPPIRPSSAALINSLSRIKSPRRVQSAGLPPRHTTYSLSPEQKELQKRHQQRQEKLKKEEEERRKEEEEEKRRENEIAFKAWLQKKKSQHGEEKRIQQAKEIEKATSGDEDRDPSEAYTLWLKRKHKERLRERRIEQLRKQEADTYLHETHEGERAFKQWLRRKRIEKHTEQQLAKERSRRLLIEARRTKQLQNLLYSISDSKTFHYLDHYS
ncbi:coiled-coil domain-containing protein 181 [Discoglossus pictus]